MGRGGPALSPKDFDFIFMVDVSGSMASDGKIQSLNAALEEVMPALRRQARDLVGGTARVGVLTFGTDVHWHTEPQDALADFFWEDVAAEEGSLTELGLALEHVIDRLRQGPHMRPPALVLLTDGMPTDTRSPTYAEALGRLNDHPVGASASRTAVGIGVDAHAESLESFVSGTAGHVVSAARPQELATVIRQAGSSVLTSASEIIT